MIHDNSIEKGPVHPEPKMVITPHLQPLSLLAAKHRPPETRQAHSGKCPPKSDGITDHRMRHGSQGRGSRQIGAGVSYQ